MKKIVEVLVTWLTIKAVALPQGNQYTSVAKFEEDKDTWEQEAWSIVLEFDNTPAKQGNPSRGTAKFLVENGPIERLVIGNRFEMYEGKVIVAEVEIL
jgi:hypothetical protein